MSPSEKRNVTIFAVLCSACLVVVIVFGVLTTRRSRPMPQPNNSKNLGPPIQESSVLPKSPRTTDLSVPAKQVPTPALSNPVASSSLLYFRTNALGDDYGKLTVAALPALKRPRYSPDLSCERLYFAGGSGVCLVADRGMFTSFYAMTFDRQLQGGKRITLNGEPSRVRVSPDGRWAAITVFISGHSYSSLAFSTQTTIVDLRSVKAICDLEQFSVTRDGDPFKSPDFNFWGVTFARDEGHFYATLWSAGKTYLVEGNFRHRTAHVIYNDVECPSLSPDNTRIAFKKKIGPRQPGWHIHLLNLSTLAETALGETRNVDDQVEWLDNSHILYALSENPNGASASTDLWSLSTKAGATPELFLKGAFSPAVVLARR